MRLTAQLTPMRSAIEHIWEYFRRLDTLEWPRDRLHIGLLASDSTDRTYERALELADERQRRRRRSRRYASISVFRRDFLPEGSKVPALGKARHAIEHQLERRVGLARSRSFLLSAALTPAIDWVLWLDVDVIEFKPSLLRDLVVNAYVAEADVVVPNTMWHSYNESGCVARC